MLASTLLISCGPKPVAVLLCFGLEIPGGPTGSCKSVIGAELDGLLSLVAVELVVAMIETVKHQCNACFEGAVLLKLNFNKN